MYSRQYIEIFSPFIKSFSFLLALQIVFIVQMKHRKLHNLIKFTYMTYFLIRNETYLVDLYHLSSCMFLFESLFRNVNNHCEAMHVGSY